MAFVPPVAGYTRDRARSEAYTEAYAPRYFPIDEESDRYSSGSRRTSLLNARKTVENTLPAWFETGFQQLDIRDSAGPSKIDRSSHHAPDLYVAETESNILPQVNHSSAEERELLAKYECDGIDAWRFSNEGVVTQSRKRGTKVVMRRIMKSPAIPTSDTRREITILSLVSDPSIATLIDWIETPDALWTVKAFRPYQTLAENVESHGPLSDAMTKTALNQLFSGITSLFLAGFAHLHICPDTVCFDDNQHLMITDLHLACAYGSEKAGNFYAPTQEKHTSDIYVAPEVFANHTYNARKAVMWSCGVLLYYMITGQTEKLNNLEHPAFDKLSRDPLSSTSPAPQSSQETPTQHRRLSVAHAKSKIILYPDRFAVPNYARAIIPKMLIQDPMRRAELIEVATRVPKDFEGKSTRPLMELAWLDYKMHVGPYAGLNIGAGGTKDGDGLQSSASSIFSAASNMSNSFGFLLKRGHSRRRSEPVTSVFSRYA